uniref:hypothetical protein n=1 Tax=unclassified Rhodococcus (in: high G+C Gram-positive bacteria) TaxID=192944 RepID=UPI0020CD6A24|nr:MULTISPECIES: hypothetical protein [unclassified Rhodococcus (in: high G+C Gram-positive bacteria)]
MSVSYRKEDSTTPDSPLTHDQSVYLETYAVARPRPAVVVRPVQRRSVAARRLDKSVGARPELLLPERLWLFLLGATSALPLMNFTATAFSLVCISVSGAYFLPGSRRHNFTPMLLAVVGTAAYLMSALANDTSVFSPTVLAFAAFGLYVCGITVLARDLTRILTVALGLVSGSAAFYLIFGTYLTASGSVDDIWKYGIAPAVTVFALYLAAMLRMRAVACSVLLLVLALVSLMLNFRSHALVCCAVVLLLVMAKYRRGALSIVPRLCTVVVFGVTFSWALEYAAREGFLGQSLREKVLSQSDGSVPMILAGRTEPVLSITSIIDRPLLGWGQANNIAPETYAHAQQVALGLGFDRSFPFQYVWKFPDGSLSLHSIVLGSWAEAGILALLLPLWLLWACYRLIFVSEAAGLWMPLLMYLGVQGVWDLLYSPWSYNLPAMFAVIACSCIALQGKGRHRAGSGSSTRSFRRRTTPPTVRTA